MTPELIKYLEDKIREEYNKSCEFWGRLGISGQRGVKVRVDSIPPFFDESRQHLVSFRQADALLEEGLGSPQDLDSLVQFYQERAERQLADRLSSTSALES